MSLACDNIGAFPLSGTVPLGVWKLPHAETVDISDNLLTQFTGKSTPNWFYLTQWGGCMEYHVYVPWWSGKIAE